MIVDAHRPYHLPTVNAVVPAPLRWLRRPTRHLSHFNETMTRCIDYLFIFITDNARDALAAMGTERAAIAAVGIAKSPIA